MCNLWQKERRSCDRRFVPREGLEPSRPCEQQILSLPCLPFHHQGLLKSGAKVHTFFDMVKYFFAECLKMCIFAHEKDGALNPINRCKEP